jgi:hypothetical protein
MEQQADAAAAPPKSVAGMRAGRPSPLMLHDATACRSPCGAAATSGPGSRTPVTTGRTRASLDIASSGSPGSSQHNKARRASLDLSHLYSGLLQSPTVPVSGGLPIPRSKSSGRMMLVPASTCGSFTSSSGSRLPQQAASKLVEAANRLDALYGLDERGQALALQPVHTLSPSQAQLGFTPSCTSCSQTSSCSQLNALGPASARHSLDMKL